MLKRRGFVVGVGAAAASAALWNGRVFAQSGGVRIGVNVERTGVATSYGQHMLIAAQIALEEVNKEGGVGGTPLELVIEDNRSSPEQAVVVTRNLDRTGVFAMLGPIQTNQCRTAFPAANRAALPAVSPGSAAPGLTAQNRPWTFRIAALDHNIVGAVVAQLHKAHPNAKKVVAAVDPRDAYNQFFFKTVAPPALEKSGLNLVNRESPIEIPSDTTDFSVFVTRVKAMDPDIVLLGASFDAAHGFLREANRQKLDAPLFAGQGYIAASMAQAAGNLELWAGQPFDPGSSDPKVEKFVAEFKRRVEKELPGQYTSPTYIDASGYETVRVLADALRAAKARPDSDVKTVRSAVRDFLAGLEDYPGLGNTIQMNKEGDTEKETMVYRTSGGSWNRL